MSISEPLPNGSERDPGASLTLRILPDPVLRLVCEPVDAFDRPLRELVEELRQLMIRHQGIGLAAPQAGVARRLFLGEIEGRRLCVVNPRLRACGVSSEEAVEGCLSLPGVEVPVARTRAVEVRGWTPEGRALSFVAEGLWARLVQHEVDHLDGRLICDYAPAPGELLSRRQAFEARTAHYRAVGYDRVDASRFVAGAAGRLRGPALDVGTGKGLLARELARLSLDVISVDVDASDLPLASDLAREAGVGERAHFLHADARRLPFRSGHFGCAAMMDVLHHLHEPRPVLAEMARTVRVGGVVIVADFSREGLRLVQRVHRAEGRVHPESGVTVEQARTLLERKGLDCVGSREAHLHEVAILVKRLSGPTGDRPEGSHR
jgi:peptide deformylase